MTQEPSEVLDSESEYLTIDQSTTNIDQQMVMDVCRVAFLGSCPAVFGRCSRLMAQPTRRTLGGTDNCLHWD